MKAVFVVLSLAIFALAEEDKKINEELDSCAKEFPISKDSYKKLLDPEADLPEDENLGCFLKCFYEKLELVNEDGQMIAFEKFEKLIPKDSPVAKMSEDCKSIKIKTCEDTIKFEKCSHNALKELLKH